MLFVYASIQTFTQGISRIFYVCTYQHETSASQGIHTKPINTVITGTMCFLGQKRRQLDTRRDNLQRYPEADVEPRLFKGRMPHPPAKLNVSRCDRGGPVPGWINVHETRRINLRLGTYVA
jgi:hypothetical protein